MNATNAKASAATEADAQGRRFRKRYSGRLLDEEWNAQREQDRTSSAVAEGCTVHTIASGRTSSSIWWNVVGGEAVVEEIAKLTGTIN